MAFAARPDVQDGKAQTEAAQWDGGLVVWWKSQRISSAAMSFLNAILLYYTRTQVVEDLIKVLDEIECGD